MNTLKKTPFIGLPGVFSTGWGVPANATLAGAPDTPHVHF